MKRKRVLILAFVICLTLVLIFVPFRASYAQRAPAPTEVFHLKWSHPLLSASINGPVSEWAAKEVTKRTNGRVQFVHYWAGSLAAPQDHLEAVRTGLTDIGDNMADYTPGKLPLYNVSSLPFLGTDVYKHTLATLELYKTNPVFEAELAKFNQKQWLLQVFSPITLYTRKSVTNAADLKGIRIRGFGHYLKFFEALGAVGVFVSLSEVYTSLQKGILDGGFTVGGAIYPYKLHEVAPYILRAPLGIIACIPSCINLDTWKKLPPDIRKVFDEVANEHPRQMADFQRKVVEEELEKLQAGGAKITNLSQEETVRWKEKAKPIWDEWIKEMEGKGLPGQQVFDEYLRAIEKYK